MYVLIAIIFIAELIIAGFLINLMLRADRKILSFDKAFASAAPEIIEGCRSLLKGVRLVQDSIGKATAYLKRKRYEFWQRIVNLIVIYLILFILRTKFKKAATLCQYMVFLKECWDSIPG